MSRLQHSEAVLLGAVGILEASEMPSFGPYFCLHTQGYNELRGVKPLFDYLEEERRKTPGRASLQVARGMELFARHYYYSKKIQQDPQSKTKPRPEDPEEAAD